MSALLWQNDETQPAPNGKRCRDRWARRGDVQYLIRSIWRCLGSRQVSRSVYAMAFRNDECIAKERFRSVHRAETWLENEVEV